jgi:hypothetical protein
MGRLAVLVRFGGAAWLLGLLGLLALHAEPGAVLAGVALALAATLLVRLVDAVPVAPAGTARPGPAGPVRRHRDRARDGHANGRPAADVAKQPTLYAFAAAR